MVEHHKRVGREHLLKTAEALFTEHGYQGVSIRMIAEASGVSKAAIYYHFESKAALFEEVMRTHTRRVNALIKRAGQAEEHILDKLKAMAGEYFHQVSHQRSLIHLVRQRTKELKGSGERKDFVEMMVSVLQPFDDVLQAAAQQGQTRKLPEGFSTAALLVGMLHSQAGYRRICHNESISESDVHLVVELMWRGIAVQDHDQEV
jgi:AcrR family transcriptional regulator